MGRSGIKARYCPAFIRDMQEKQSELGFSTHAFSKYLGFHHTCLYCWYDFAIFPNEISLNRICKKLKLDKSKYKIEVIDD